jgi:prolyl 4-hydroxylase
MSAFDNADYQIDENKDEGGFYKNSKGAYNLAPTLAFVGRITNAVKRMYPNAEFCNSYTREYKRGSYLGMHIDRVELDLTLSICIENKNNIDWSLNISSKTCNNIWSEETDHDKYKTSFNSVSLPVGYGAFIKGKQNPHWRDELLCGENQRMAYVFYHWTIKEDYSLLLNVKLPDLSLFSNFLSILECNELIADAEKSLELSTVVGENDEIIHTGRTSSGMFYQRKQNSLIEKIETRISRLTNIPVEHGEGLQILRYEEGQEYTPHFDYFPLSDSSTERHVGKWGQRVATILMYLNTPSSGGETVFPDADIRISAKQGNALLFKYPIPDASTKTLHSGTPVKKGVKWVATKWLRETIYD